MSDKVITNRDRLRQVIDFGGMKFGTGMPTDLDAIIEWRNQAWVIIELKRSAPMPLGQRLMFERLVADLSSIKPTLAIIATHATRVGEDVSLADAIVTEYWICGVKETEHIGDTVREVVSGFLSSVDASIQMQQLQNGSLG